MNYTHFKFYQVSSILHQFSQSHIRKVSTTSNTPIRNAKSIIKAINNNSLTRKEQVNSEGKKCNSLPLHKKQPEWKKQKLALYNKFNGQQWNPAKKLSRDEIEQVRMLRENFPSMNAKEISEHFKVSPESIRRILKTKWKPTEEEMLKIQERWKRRGKRIDTILGRKWENTSTGKLRTPIYTRKLVFGSDRSGTTINLKSIHHSDVSSKVKSNATKIRKGDISWLLKPTSGS